MVHHGMLSTAYFPNTLSIFRDPLGSREMALTCLLTQNAVKCQKTLEGGRGYNLAPQRG
jgi:hypothetical protein